MVTKAEYFVVRVNRDSSDTFAASSLDEAVEAAQPDSGDRLEYVRVAAIDAGAARIVRPGRTDWKPIPGCFL